MKYLILPDVQHKPGLGTAHLGWAGKYAADKRPDTIVCLGDFADMPSLSTYDIGKMEFEGRTYKQDINAAKEAMAAFMLPIKQLNSLLARGKKQRYNPKLVMLLGNHEDRITRAISKDRKLEGLISLKDLEYEKYGWEVHQFLEVVVLDGIAFSHYFTSGLLGRPITSARAILVKKHCSAVMGHVQKRDIAYDTTADGRQLTAIFAGSYYQHDEQYLGPQGNKHWRGLWMLHNVDNGSFDEMPVPLSYLKEKYS